jgi:hypothetical protein
MRILPLRAFLALLLVAAFPLVGKAVPTLSLRAAAVSYFSETESDPGSFYLTGFVSGLSNNTTYRLTTPGGTVADNGGSAPLAHGSWAELVAVETASLWTLTLNPGGLGEISYFFNVGLGSIVPEPFLVSASHISGAPADQWHVDISGPVDRGPFDLFYTANLTSSEPIFESYSLPAGTTGFNLTLAPGSDDMSLLVTRTTFSSEFATASIPTTAGGAQLAGWTLAPSRYRESGQLDILDLPSPGNAVPDTASTLGLLLVSIGALAAWRHRAARPAIHP